MRAGSHHLVAKRVAPPASSRGGGGADVGHCRKLRSYEVEAAFYRHYAPLMRQDASEGGPAELCPIARPYLIQAEGDDESEGGAGGGVAGGNANPTSALLLLEDLRPEFPRQPRSYGAEEAKRALEWLAAFHATWFERPAPPSAVAEDKERRRRRRGGEQHDPDEPDDADPLVPPLLWGSGCYWHLSTRLEELEAIDGGDLPKALAAAAHSVDEALRGFGRGRLRYRTLSHGDAKAANFVFGPPGREDGAALVAGYDFQYVGGAYGPRDVAYLLCSSVDERVLAAPGGEDALLDHYRAALLDGLKKRGHRTDGDGSDPYPREALVRHFELSLVDLCRFMAGWGWWGASRWAQRRAREVLARLPELLEAERRSVMDE
jgi:hypothetical protein